jgi:hypothetical protein
MLTAALALILTVATSYAIVEAGFALAGRNTPARVVVALAAVATGFIVPWAIVAGLVGLATDED